MGKARSARHPWIVVQTPPATLDRRELGVGGARTALNGEAPLDLGILGEIDVAHGAGAEPSEDPEAAERGAGSEGHPWRYPRSELTAPAAAGAGPR